ncbi:MAG: replication initiator protein, partial [Nocardiaceae bacterium]|nr:replication initiator protein [Nocardiaceae bacterium]
PCGNTIESVCPTCARKAKVLRMTQCREGWHAEVEPIVEARKPSDEEKDLATERADLVEEYRQALDKEAKAAIRDQITEVDTRLRALGVRGKLPDPDGSAKRPKSRSTKRRQDSPNLPRKKVAKTTVGREFAGRFRPSMFITLTCDSYGRVRDDGTPVDPGSYDYRRAARDAVHFAALVDRWWQNLRRVLGWNAQYFATVEPQRRAAPHLHAAVRGSIPHEVLRQVTEATYHQVWWPAHDEPVYSSANPPRWDHESLVFVDPETGAPLTDWDTAVEGLSQPAHVVRFGRQVHSKGILGGTEESNRHIGYLTKYLMKSTSELVDTDGQRQHAHHNALHAELAKTPCSSRCAVWLLYGIQPVGANSSTIPGQCRGRAHRRATLGLPGRRVLVSRQWSGKTLTDHNLDRVEFVRQALAEIGIEKPNVDQSQYTWRLAKPGDPLLPPRSLILMTEIAKRTRWRAEYDRALLACNPSPAQTSATAA